MPVEADYGDGADAWSPWRMCQGSTPTGGRVANVEVMLLRQDEQAITGGMVYNGDSQTAGIGGGGVPGKDLYLFIT